MTGKADVYVRQGFGGALEPCPPYALLIVDFVNGFADPRCLGGGNIGVAIGQTRRLLGEARARRWPVAHSRIVFADGGADANVFSAKVPALLRLTERAVASHIVDALAPEPDELVVCKTAPSAFFGTGLAAWFIRRAVRTVLVAGSTTSGCVRASVVDAMSGGWLPIVVTDCVGDRSLDAHRASLFDLEQKYATLLSLDAALELTHATAEGR